MNDNATSHVEVSRVIPAEPARLYALVSDLPRMGEWSPENDGGRWIKGAAGPTVGARFEGSNSHGTKSWTTTVEIDEADPARAFTFRSFVGPIKVARWRYQFDSVEGGTRVTETWDDQRNWLAKRIGGMASGVADRAAHNRSGMETTLDNLAAAAAAPATDG